MKGIFDFNNPVMSFLSKLADLMILNCCSEGKRNKRQMNTN